MSAIFPSFSAQALTCLRGGRTLFSGLSFELSAGSLMQVVGPNGCGKTSLLRILSGLRQPDAGCVRWAGVAIEEAEDDFTENLAYLGVQSALKRELTPLENLGFSLALARTACLTPGQALEALRLTPLADIPCQRLSTGQVRRVALARLLMLGSPLWILDEPLTGLDQDSRRDFEQAMLRGRAAWSF
jgi:heme exporter protein A